MKNKEIKFKFLKIIGIVLLFIVTAILFFVGYALIWMMTNWSNISLFELISQLKSLNGGAGSTVTLFITRVVLPTIFTTLFLVVLYVLFNFIFKNKKKALKISKISVLVTSIVVSCCFAIPSFISAYNYLKVDEYISNSKAPSEFIDTYYVSPSDVEISFPNKKRNLILLTLESVEMTYTDISHGGFFEDNYISELTDLALENECFNGEDGMLNGATTLEYTNWTMAALFSYSSGLPFKTSLGQNNMDTQESFFPNVISLGDILNQEGYDQTFLCGSDSSFAGRDLYFQSHGNYTIHDYYTYYKQYNLGWENQWGFMDYHLYKFAKDEIKEKALNYDEESKPFNYTFLTVDTHFYVGDSSKEDGFICDDCPDTYEDNQYANVISCASKKANEFVSWFFGKDGNDDISQNVRDNTTIVVLGDHPTMSNYFCLDADRTGFPRRTYVNFINSAKTVENKNYRTYSHFDIYPTIISSLGATIVGDALALGIDLYSGKPTYLETFEKDYINAQLQGKSEVIDSLLKVNPYEYAYLKRMGRLPTATVVFEEKESTILFKTKDLKMNGLNEELENPILILLIGKKYQKIKMSIDEENDFFVEIDKEILLNEGKLINFIADVYVSGVTSNNDYNLGSVSYIEEEK